MRRIRGANRAEWLFVHACLRGKKWFSNVWRYFIGIANMKERCVIRADPVEGDKGAKEIRRGRGYEEGESPSILWSCSSVLRQFSLALCGVGLGLRMTFCQKIDGGVRFRMHVRIAVWAYAGVESVSWSCGYYVVANSRHSFKGTATVTCWRSASRSIRM